MTEVAAAPNVQMEAPEVDIAPEVDNEPEAETVVADPNSAGDTELEPPPEKRRRHKCYRVDTILPKRPKRAPTGYTQFLKGYFLTQPRGRVGKRSMRAASAEWKSLEPEDRQNYEDSCAVEKARYDSEMAIWKAQKSFIKRPAAAYALFLKDFWEANRETSTNTSLTDMGKRAAEIWKAKSEEEKSVYRDRYEVNKIERDVKLEALNAGNVVLGESGELEVVPGQSPVDDEPEEMDEDFEGDEDEGFENDGEDMENDDDGEEVDGGGDNDDEEDDYD